jgi:pyruvate ferredoxin oxidoreductase beta subunit/2-oxoisovalerate ferredoxin oxidoreductase beta subunit
MSAYGVGRGAVVLPPGTQAEVADAPGRTAAVAMEGIPCTDECLLRAGHTNCGGCGMSLGLNMLGRALAERNEKAVLSIPACCGIVAAGAFPTTSYGSPTIATTFASAAAVAAGVAAIRDLNDDGGQSIAFAGDGGTYDIGFATLSIAHPEDFRRKVHTAIDTKGLRFLLMHSPCPTGWKSEPAESVQLVRLAVRTGLFPLYEIWNGTEYRINVEPDWTDPAEYFAGQRRFRDEEIDLDVTRRVCRQRFERLQTMERAFPREAD